MYKNALKEDLIRVVEDLDGTVESTDTIAKLKTKIEKSSTFESDADFVKTLIKNCIDERVSRNEREAILEKQKIELAKLQLAQLEKEVKLQTAKNKALSLNPAAKEELNDYEKLKSIVLREFQVTPRECLNSFKNVVKSSGETYIQFAARLTANFQYYCSLRKVNVFESLCDILISDKLFETLNKETDTHIGIREAEDWFRPIDLAKECDIYISSRSGSRKETPIACGYTEYPFKNRPRNFKPKIRDNYPQYLERQNKNCYICGDSSHYARYCEKRFKPKESHIHNRKNVNSLKVKSEKQKSDEFAQLQYVNIFVENQPVTALIDSGCQIPVLNSSLIRVNKPSEERITLSSCFNERRMVDVAAINISLTQHSPSLSVRTAISPTSTKEFREYCENENIQHLSITTGIPRGNGQIERIHSSLIPILSKLSIDDASKWYKFVPAVQRTLNSTISRSTQMTPFLQLLTGVKMRTKQDLEILKLLEEEIVEAFTENRRKIREEAKRNILKMQEENCRNFNKKRKKACQYEIGDIVAIQRTQFGTGLKLRPKFFGPYGVVKVKPKDRYDVRKIGLHE
ncbi:pro-Pol polyprotein [Trichonephila clavipes]|nr:pro-Pol polyprotein [Trichonephila clavipes]